MNANIKEFIFFYFSRLFTDKVWIQIVYYHSLHKFVNFNNPVTFNEKIQWLKLYDKRKDLHFLMDKYAVREFVKKNWGEEHLFPILGVWNDPDSISFDDLPNQFVLKCNHDSGSVYICKDKSSFDKKGVVKKLKRNLKHNYFYAGREYGYKFIQRKVFAEKYMVDESGYELKDYKVFTFGGNVQYIQVDYDRFTDHHRNFYDRNWNYVPFTTCYPTDPDRQIKKPENLDELIEAAEKLACATGNPAYLRIDLYDINNHLYFGELTFYHGSGNERFYPESYDKKLGDLINLSKK